MTDLAKLRASNYALQALPETRLPSRTSARRYSPPAPRPALNSTRTTPSPAGRSARDLGAR